LFNSLVALETASFESGLSSEFTDYLCSNRDAL
jgi:hypothetical protein